MDDLRLVRREDQSLIVATEGGEEFRLLVDETVLAELRHLSRPARGPVRANPREVQALVRAGRTRAEIAEATGLEESDIERYEEPVLAERRYVLERAHAVAVRTSPTDETEQQFGTVIAERLIGLGAADQEWTSWRDDEAGWMIALAFRAGESEHRAVWAFDHRKALLSPLTSDAESLSKQGSVGDRLIPKLRAVDSTERFDSGAFDPDKLTAGFADADDSEPPVNLSGPVAPDHPSTGSIPVVDAEAEYARRQHIEERAIKSPARELPDLGQTADLLDALRRRRGERDAADASADEMSGDAVEPWAEDSAGDPGGNEPVPFPGSAPVATLIPPFEDAPVSDATVELTPVRPTAADESTDERADAAGVSEDDAENPREPLGPASDRGRRGKGRASIPSWDDILFGTRSEDDPA